MATRKKIPKRKPRPKPRAANRRPQQQPQAQPQQQAQPQAQPQQQAPQLTAGERAQQLGDYLGQGSASIAKGVGTGIFSVPLGFAEGLGSGLGGVFGQGGARIGGAMAKYGLMGAAMPHLATLLKSGYDRATESDTEKEIRVKTEGQKKYEQKVTSAIMGPRTDGFTLQDLDDADNGQDAGWREAVHSMKDDEYEKLASEAIKNDDPNKIWNAVIRKAQASGKKVNASKPLYLPNTFEKDGKTYAYAIDGSEKDDNGRPKVRFVPIEIGKMPFQKSE